MRQERSQEAIITWCACRLYCITVSRHQKQNCSPKAENVFNHKRSQPKNILSGTYLFKETRLFILTNFGDQSEKLGSKKWLNWSGETNFF